MISDICSDFFRPIFFHDFPPSILLYTPSPYPTCLPPTFSPVPTHITFGLEGSIAIEPIE